MVVVVAAVVVERCEGGPGGEDDDGSHGLGMLVMGEISKPTMVKTRFWSSFSLMMVCLLDCCRGGVLSMDEKVEEFGSWLLFSLARMDDKTVFCCW